MSRRLPSLNWLRVFEAAARTGSFARAAERLAMSPPAVSQQIRALEDHLGRPLFERAAAGVRLTEAGRALLAGVSDALGRIDAATTALAAPGGPPLVIGVSLMMHAGWLLPRLPAFMAAHPHITLELHALVGREVPPRSAALWVAFGPPPPGTRADVLFGETLVPVAHPDIAGRIEVLEDLLRYPLIEVADHRRTWAQVFGSDLLPAEARVVHVDTTLAALALAGARGGIALARPPASTGLETQHGLVPCLEGFSVPGVEQYHLLAPANVRPSRDAERFRAWLLDAVGS
jgi:LysR family glycine cleavage system transcriptional activator